MALFMPQIRSEIIRADCIFRPLTDRQNQFWAWINNTGDNPIDINRMFPESHGHIFVIFIVFN